MYMYILYYGEFLREYFINFICASLKIYKYFDISQINSSKKESTCISDFSLTLISNMPSFFFKLKSSSENSFWLFLFIKFHTILLSTVVDQSFFVCALKIFFFLLNLLSIPSMFFSYLPHTVKAQFIMYSN